MSERIRFWPDGARTAGRCSVTRGCLGVMMVVERMDGWDWAQCSQCLEESGIGMGAPVAAPLPARDDDAFLDRS